MHLHPVPIQGTGTAPGPEVSMLTIPIPINPPRPRLHDTPDIHNSRLPTQLLNAATNMREGWIERRDADREC